MKKNAKMKTMKNLILLLLLVGCIPVPAQNITKKYAKQVLLEMDSIDQRGKALFDLDIDHVDKTKESCNVETGECFLESHYIKIQCIKLSDIYEYEKECYNDSTITRKHKADGLTTCIYEVVTTLSYNPNMQIPECHNPNHYINHWEHKPFIPKDFINWLHKKYDK